MQNSSLLLFIGAVGGALITGLIGPYVIQSKDRRVARAEVFKAIRKVESSRWGDEELPTLRSHMADLRAAALVARADRRITEYYTHVALISHNSGEQEYDDEGKSINMVPSPIGDLVNDALETYMLTLWHPVRTYFTRGLLLKRLKKKELLVKERIKKDYSEVSQDIWDRK
jgi:hypothetical protein